MTETYSLLLYVLPLMIFFVSLYTLFMQIKDEWVRGILKSMISKYLHIENVILNPEAILIFPIMAIFYTFVLFIKLRYQKKFGYFLNTIVEDKVLKRKVLFCTLLTSASIIFNISKLYLPYGIVLAFFLIVVIREIKLSRDLSQTKKINESVH